jgi:hypothetical protein
MIWSQQSKLDDLLREKLEEGDIWEKCEAYMIKLVAKEDDREIAIASLRNRLKVYNLKSTGMKKSISLINSSRTA